MLTRILLLSLLLRTVLCEEGPPAVAMMAQRLMETLPDLPEVISGQMQGNHDGFKKMLSTVLGDGLISQLVVDPVGTAEEMGVSMDSLGINKTDVIARLNNATNGLAGSYLESSKRSALINSKAAPSLGLPNLFTTTPATTKMYIDGVPVDDLDEFIRKHNYRDQNGRPFFKTQHPTTTQVPTTTPMPSAEQIAESVLNALKRGRTKETASQINDPFPSVPDVPAYLGSNSIHEYRRSPQKIDTLSSDLPVLPLDPQVDSVLTTLRTRSLTGLTVEEVKNLQVALQQYEQTLQTKELYAKRKQLQVLQDELIQQKKRIEEQRRMEEELRRQEKELEEKRLEMELQLQQQLNNWHSSFNRNPPGVEMPTLSPLSMQQNIAFVTDIPPPQDDMTSDFMSNPDAPVPPTGLLTPSSSQIQQAAPPGFQQSLKYHAQPIFSIKPVQPKIATSPIESYPVFGADHLIDNEAAQIPIPSPQAPSPPPSQPVRSALSQLRYSPSVLTKDEDYNEDTFPMCECISVSLAQLQGSWVPALASKAAMAKTQSAVDKMGAGQGSRLQCSRYDFSNAHSLNPGEVSDIVWIYKTTGSRQAAVYNGKATTHDGLQTMISLDDQKGHKLNMPICILKTGGRSYIDYMVIVNAQGPCNEATLLVRNPDTFFDNQNFELSKYLKHKIAQKEMDSMNIVPYANDCQ